MMDAMDIAPSGATAAGQRTAVVAGNIANVLSTAVSEVGSAGSTGNQRNTSGQRGADGEAEFQPLRVEPSSDANDGVRIDTRPIDPPSFAVFDLSHPDAGASGTVALPNDSLANVLQEREFVDLAIAQRAYEASIATANTADQMLGTVLDREF